MSRVVLVILIASLGPSCSGAPQYTLQGDPQTQSRIRREAATWSLPFDKTYEELTAEQRDRLRAAYVELGADEEPPYPLQGMKAIAQPLSEAQQTMRQSGRVFAVAAVDAEGDVQSIIFRETPNEDTAKVVGWILVRTRFKPATCGGTPCAMEYPVQIDLKLR